jgi:hypothetical protein
VSTRGLIGFVFNGEEKLSYNHFDSYPEGLGLSTLGWLRDNLNERLPARVEKLQAVASDGAPDHEDVQRAVALELWGEDRREPDDWYELLRDTQGDLGAQLEFGRYVDAAGFAGDSLFCEWGYVIDLDQMMLEVYRGYQQLPHDAGRFAALELSREEDLPSTYYPIRLVCAFSLLALPDDAAFVAAVRASDPLEVPDQVVL